MGAHWRRGLGQLDRDWEQAGQDVARFVERLVEVAELPLSGGGPRHVGGNLPGATFSSGEIQVPIGEVGEDVATKEQVLWNVNGKGGSPHSAIMGGSGSGKTVTAAARRTGDGRSKGRYHGDSKPMEVSMAQVVIRNLDDEVVERLKARAAAEQKSLEQKLRDVLTDAAKPSRAELLAELDRCHAMTPPHPPGAPLAEDLIREDRDNRRR